MTDLAKFKKFRALEKCVEERRKQLISLIPVEADMIKSMEAIASKLKQEFPEWYKDA